MAREPEQEGTDRLLRDYRIYDEAVDIVSAFEGLFTQSASLPATVRHFERYPRIKRPDSDDLAPDFTVVFNDGAGIAGEVSRLSLRDESLDTLAQQVGNYDRITELPVGKGGTAQVTHTDVLLLIKADVAVQAFTRLRAAANDPDHPYNPSRLPCIVQFSLVDNKYVFIRHADPDNPRLRENSRPRDDKDRTIAIGAWMEESSVSVPDTLFIRPKVARAFMNDPLDPLYLASHLWQREIAEMAGAARGGTRIRVELSEAEVARLLRTRYGTGRKAEVGHAMKLLERAGLAERIDHNDRWAVAFHQLARGRSTEVHRVIAKRAYQRRVVSELRRMHSADAPPVVRKPDGQGALFNSE
jgi:hypothetical protein